MGISLHAPGTPAVFFAATSPLDVDPTLTRARSDTLCMYVCVGGRATQQRLVRGGTKVQVLWHLTKVGLSWVGTLTLTLFAQVEYPEVFVSVSVVRLPARKHAIEPLSHNVHCTVVFTVAAVLHLACAACFA